MMVFILYCFKKGGTESLFLARSSLLLGLLNGTLGTDTSVALDTGELAEGRVSLELLVLLGDLTGAFSNDGIDDGEGTGNALLGGSSTVGSRAVTLLGGLGLLGEDNQAGHVGGQAGLVQLQGLLGAVAATVVDGNTDGASNLAGDPGSLQLVQGEATAGTDLAVVLDGGAADGGAEGLDGAGGNEGGLGDTGGAAALLAAGLVEPGPDAAGPLLVEMAIRKLVVVLHLEKGLISLLHTWKGREGASQLQTGFDQNG